MPFVVSDFASYEFGARRLAVVREVEKMDHARLFLEDRLPAEVDNALEAERLVVLLPTMSDEDRVRLGKRDELELWKRWAERMGNS